MEGCAHVRCSDRLTLKGRARATVVIPAYRNADVGACLESLFASRSTACPFAVHVVLNDATAQVEEIVAAFAEGLTTTRLTANHGVSGAFNQGFAAAETEYVVQLQDDVRVQPGWLGHLIECADAAPDAGAVASLTLDGDGIVSDPGWIVTVDGRTTPGLIGGSRDPDDYVGARPIDYHGSTGVLVRRRAWQSVGGFDHGYYPAYYGDVDFCWRLRERGWRVLLEPRSRVRHAGHLSSTSPYREFLAVRNRARFMAAHQAALDACSAVVGDEAAVDRAIMALAAMPPGPVPPDPTDDELGRLRERLALEPAAFLRLERDVRTEYATWLENALTDRRTAHEHLERELRHTTHLLAEAGERERALTRRLEESDRRAAEADEANRRFAASRSWRLTAPLRHVRRRLGRGDASSAPGRRGAP